MKNKKIIGVVAICLVVAGLSFKGGMLYTAKNIKAAADSRQGVFTFNQNTNGQFGQRSQGMRNGALGGLVNGEILSKDDKSITVKLRDGGSKIVFFTPAVKVEKTIDGTSSDVVVGKQVMVVGSANADGSINATSIQMRPAQVLEVSVKQ